ncbi:MAG: hypothetical protein RQ733_09180 [Methyloprofundus sp.]|nr:hypothetical protein [Methyloprofundus sp.]MDT8426132.1 hypothetical protein [Methyloprofundus sp.]
MAGWLARPMLFLYATAFFCVDFFYNDGATEGRVLAALSGGIASILCGIFLVIAGRYHLSAK